MAGEGREGVSQLIYSLNIFKKRTFYGDGPLCPSPSSSLSHLCWDPTRPPSFASMRPGLVPLCLASFPSCYQTRRQRGILVTPSGVVDMLWTCRLMSWVVVEVLGTGDGGDVDVVKGSGWCER